MQALLQDRIREAQQLLQRVDKLCLQQKVEGKAKLCSKLRAELNFLTKVETGAVVIKESHLHSTNLTHLKAIVESAESLESVVALLHVFAYEDSGGTRQTLVVDVVANKGHTWVKAIGRKAEALHNIWQGRGQYGDKSVVHQAEDFLLASRQQPVLYSQPSVVFAFYNGISKPMADQLTQMGVSVRGDIVAVNALEGEVEEEEEGEGEEGGDGAEGLMGMEAPQDTACEGEGGGEQEEGSELNHTCVDRQTVVASLAFPTLQVEECVRVNLDITTLITLVSSLSHGRCRLAFREPVLTEQAAQERQQPVLPGLHAFLQGKELFACSAAVADFQSILETLGGPGEKKRAQELLGRVALVEDQPSPRTLRLAVSSKVNRRSLMIFGTGDTLQAVTTTANSGFVRAAANQGVRFSVFIHQPRALTEAKEWRATPTGP